MEKLITQYVSVWNEKDTSNLNHLFQNQAYYWDPAQEGNAIELLNSAVLATHDAFPDVSLETLSLKSSAEDVFFLEWKMTGTNTGSFFGSEPTGKKIEIKGLDSISCKDGKISEIKSFYDSSSLTQQLS
ncbi:MAG: ester cyclase [Cyclobacteriaceae bacterium]